MVLLSLCLQNKNLLLCTCVSVFRKRKSKAIRKQKGKHEAKVATLCCWGLFFLCFIFAVMRTDKEFQILPPKGLVRALGTTRRRANYSRSPASHSHSSCHNSMENEWDGEQIVPIHRLGGPMVVCSPIITLFHRQRLRSLDAALAHVRDLLLIIVICIR